MEVGKAWEVGCDVLVYLGRCKKRVVVACYEEFMRMGLGFKPGEDAVMFVLSPGHSEVACMNEDVAVWERGLGDVGVVGVGNADDADGVWVGFRLGGWCPTVQQMSEEKKRGRMESFPDRWQTQCVHVAEA